MYIIFNNKRGAVPPGLSTTKYWQKSIYTLTHPIKHNVMLNERWGLSIFSYSFCLVYPLVAKRFGTPLVSLCRFILSFVALLGDTRFFWGFGSIGTCWFFNEDSLNYFHKRVLVWDAM